MSQTTRIRLYGVTAHFRDPRYNTGSLDTLPLRTLHCPPPATIHGLICAAAGRWVAPETLELGWQMTYASVGADFQTCQLPQRPVAGANRGVQTGRESSPRVREFLALPLLTLLAVRGVNKDWFRRPANPLSLGRSEDLVVRTICDTVDTMPCTGGVVSGQCLPFGSGFGTLYPAPLYFVGNRQPVGISPCTDIVTPQNIRGLKLIQTQEDTPETFYLWRYSDDTSG